MRVGRAQQVDFLVAGSGVAGLRAAIELAGHGSVLVLTKGDPCGPVAHSAGGAALAPLSDGGGAAVPVQETLRQGDGLCREPTVHILAEEGPQQIHQLSEWGVHLVQKARVKAPAGDSKRGAARVPECPAGSDVMAVLAERAKTLPSVRIKARAIVLDLVIENGRLAGATYLDQDAGCQRTVQCQAALIATGGLGQVFAETTSPLTACGDGIALAYHAGALLSDMEFVQFHPTVLFAKTEPRVLLPRALCERGACMRNVELERFMSRYHEAGELAPADVVSRAILCEMQKGKSSFVYLDLTGLDSEYVKRRFPRVHAACLASNIDITSDLVPARPAAHFTLGGIATDARGATSIGGLYAAGEAACTGVHGANRIANNSLLESLVFGVRAARAMSDGSTPPDFLGAANEAAGSTGGSPSVGAEPLDPAAAKREIRRLMWESAGIIRNGAHLHSTVNRLRDFALVHPEARTRESSELESLLLAARLIARCAEARKESRGAHYRADFPLRNDSEPARHSFVSKDQSVYFA